MKGLKEIVLSTFLLASPIVNGTVFSKSLKPEDIPIVLTKEDSIKVLEKTVDKGEAYMSYGDYEKALLSFEEALKYSTNLDPINKAYIHGSLGFLYGELNNKQKSVENCLTAYNLEPFSITYANNLAFYSAKTDTLLEQALELATDNLKLELLFALYDRSTPEFVIKRYSTLAYVQYKLKDYENALSNFNEAINLLNETIGSCSSTTNKNQGFGYYYLAKTLEMIGEDKIKEKGYTKKDIEEYFLKAKELGYEE